MIVGARLIRDVRPPPESWAVARAYRTVGLSRVLEPLGAQSPRQKHPEPPKLFSAVAGKLQRQREMEPASRVGDHAIAPVKMLPTPRVPLLTWQVCSEAAI